MKLVLVLLGKSVIFNWFSKDSVVALHIDKNWNQLGIVVPLGAKEGVSQMSHSVAENNSNSTLW